MPRGRSRARSSSRGSDVVTPAKNYSVKRSSSKNKKASTGRSTSRASKNATHSEECANRDERGLKPVTEENPATEDSERAKYTKMMFVMMPLIGQGLCWALYFVLCTVLKQRNRLMQAFDELSASQLGFVYLSVIVIQYGRKQLIINANSVRASARLGRPDQHIYRVMSPNFDDEAYVLMANTGSAGRFNRAQRAVFNTDESFAACLVNTLLAGYVFGPIVTLLCVVQVYGRNMFAVGYTQSADNRGSGFKLALIAEVLLENLVLFCAIQSCFLDPFGLRF